MHKSPLTKFFISFLGGREPTSSPIIGEPILPGDIEINEVFLNFLISMAREKGTPTDHLELALERVKNGKDWRTGE